MQERRNYLLFCKCLYSFLNSLSPFFLLTLIHFFKTTFFYATLDFLSFLIKLFTYSCFNYSSFLLYIFVFLIFFYPKNKQRTTHSMEANTSENQIFYLLYIFFWTYTNLHLIHKILLNLLLILRHSYLQNKFSLEESQPFFMLWLKIITLFFTVSFFHPSLWHFLLTLSF